MKYQLIPLLWIMAIYCYGQSSATAMPPHPIFSNFQGDVFKMPVVEYSKGNKKFKGLQEFYGENVYEYEKIAHIDIPELNIKETTIDEGKFPGLERNTQYAMVLESTVTIKVKACYEFSLDSDDGSILWINEEKIVDNDGGHGMTMKKDSVVFEPGTYPVKVWYFQSLADRFGCILAGKIIGRPAACPNVESSSTQEKLSFNTSVLFNVGSARFRTDAAPILAEIRAALTEREIQSINIIGHTDSTGSSEKNQLLSLARANFVKATILEMFPNLADSQIKTEGKGELEPIDTNETKEGRERNRRVVIIIK